MSIPLLSETIFEIRFSSAPVSSSSFVKYPEEFEKRVKDSVVNGKVCGSSASPITPASLCLPIAAVAAVLVVIETRLRPGVILLCIDFGLPPPEPPGWARAGAIGGAPF